MNSILKIIGFIVGITFSFLAVSGIASGTWPPSYIEILATLLLLAFAFIFLYYSGSSQRQRINVFALAGSLIMAYGLVQIWMSIIPAQEVLQPIAEQMAGSTTENINKLAKLYEIHRSFGLSSIAFGGLYLLVAFVAFLLSRRSPGNEKTPTIET